MAKVAKMSGAADLSRKKELAGQTVSQKGGWNVTYDENGYATSASNYNHTLNKGTDRGIAAPSSDAVLSGGNRNSSGGSATDRSYLNDKELAHLTTLQERWQQASAAGDQDAMRRAHEEAESIRARYGYSGGTDGSEYNELSVRKWDPDAGGGSSRSGGGGSYSGGGGVSGSIGGNLSYAQAPQYVNRYQSQIDELTAQILGREAFSYDPETDPAYQQYKTSYTRGGERAMQDTLAQLAARTGGLASSYAGSAAQQTYDNYMAALADKVPELRQLAYSMYQDEGNNLRNNLSMLASLEQGDYNKFADQLSQYNTDRSFNYNAYRDLIGDQRYANEWNYQVGRDQISDQRYNDETAYNRSLYATENQYKQDLDKAKLLASIGDYSGYRALGYSDQEINNLTNAYNAAQLLAQQSSARKSGGSGGSKSGGNSGAADGDVYSRMYQAGVRNEGDAYAWLLANGYNTTQAGKLAGYFTSWVDANQTGGGTSAGFTGLTGNGTLGGNMLAGALNGLFGNSQSGSSGLSSSVRNTINEQLSSGKTQQALGYIGSIWNGLNSTQKDELQAILSRYGVAYNP